MRFNRRRSVEPFHWGAFGISRRFTAHVKNVDSRVRVIGFGGRGEDAIKDGHELARFDAVEAANEKRSSAD